MNELGFYRLAGAPKTPRELIAEVQRAEELGLGAARQLPHPNPLRAGSPAGGRGATTTSSLLPIIWGEGLSSLATQNCSNARTH
ncbi:MAG: hypothetical protein IH865_04515 [Chloroflexi bacterium]|nr:hypothetical protein [Chloroflexota bacterium]